VKKPGTPLYAHQEAAARKLAPLPYGALFMDMGTGKSRTAIELAHRWRARNVVWFAPVSLKETVRQEIRKHVPWSRPYVFGSRTGKGKLPRHFWTVVGIESMSSSTRQVLATHALVNQKTLVIVDESSYIKGHRSWRTLRITDMGKKAGRKLILTGTPMSQGVEDLFAQMRFLDQRILGYSSWYTFARNHLEYSEKYPGMILRAHDTALLADKIAPWTYQVTKDECLDLPPKVRKTVYYRMSPEQRETYERAKWEILGSVPDHELDSYVIFRLFTALQQITSGYWRRGPGDVVELPDPRFDALVELLGCMRGQAIVWCKYLRSLHKIADALGANAALLYGGLNERRRNAEIEKFKRGDAQFLVATAATGGHGLNLTEATTAVFHESSFKYAERIQAEDRCHRIGQDKKVLYVDLVCSGSIDDRIARSLAKKRDAVEDFKRKVNLAKDDPDAMRELMEVL